MGGGKDDASGDQEVNILILRSAVKDLINGREFYERQGEVARNHIARLNSTGPVTSKGKQ